MLKENKLLIDKSCPMCKAYGQAFTKMKLIDADTVTYYQGVQLKGETNIDYQRAKDEIALYDSREKSTAYGIDAMIKIVSHSSMRLNALLNSRIVYPVLLRLYRFISYNRKVIYPSASRPGECDCTPSVNIKYRVLYLLLTALFTGFVLNEFAYALNSELGLNHWWWREYVVCFGQIGWQIAFLQIIKSKNTIEYLGNMSTVSLIGGLLLLPILFLNVWIHLPATVLVISFMVIVSVMLLEHLRRCKILHLPITTSLSWVLYRLFVLIIIALSL